jgi:hypothetical protein
MARIGEPKNPFKGLENAFEKQPHTIGNMPAPSAMMHHATMMPRGNPTDTGATKGNGPGFGNPTAGALGGKGVQSSAQHMAVEKAAKTSAMRRKKAF